MNKTFKAAIAAAVALTCAQGARADLTISGAVGLPLNPTAQIPNEGGIRLQGNYYDLGNPGGGSVKDYGLFAAGRISDNFELSGGINKLDVPGGGPLDRVGGAIGAKYLFTRESDPAGVRFAVGAGYDHGLAENLHVYGVATKYLGDLTEGKVPITGHLGLRFDRFDFGGGPGGESDKLSIFAGAEVPLTRTGEFQLVGEIQSKNLEFAGAKFPYSIGARYRPQGSPFGVSVGWQRQGLTADSGLYLQLGYTFDTTN